MSPERKGHPVGVLISAPLVSGVSQVMAGWCSSEHRQVMTANSKPVSLDMEHAVDQA